MKILYLYAGKRQGKLIGVINRDYPDSALYGINYLPEFGIKADFRELGDHFLGRLLGRWLPFNVNHALMYFTARRYDIVFGPALLPLMLLKKIFGGRTRYVFLNISLGRMLRVNKKHHFVRRVMISLLKEFHEIVCLALFQKEELEREFPMLQGKLSFVPLSVDTLYHVPSPLSVERVGVLAVGKDNGRDYVSFVETARLVPNARFTIVATPRNLVGVKDIPKNVGVFLGLPMDEVKKLYESAEVAVIPTKSDDFFDGADCSGQTVLLEYMASGLPIVATARKSLKGYIEHEKDALIVPPENAEAMAAAITCLMNDKPFAGRLALAAREKAVREFSSKRMALRLALLFKRLIPREYTVS